MGVLVRSFLLVILCTGCVNHVSRKMEERIEPPRYFSQLRTGVNFFNDEETLERMMAVKKLSVDFIRLTPSKWQSVRTGAKLGTFLMGDEKRYRGLIAEDVRVLKSMLDLALKAHLRVVLTFLNILAGCGRQHNGNTPDCRLWQDFSYHEQAAQFMTDVTVAIGNHEALVAINPLNEPEPEHCASVALDWANKDSYAQWHRENKETPRDLNSLYKRIHASIRSVNRTIALVFDASFYATPWALPFLTPLDDKNVIYSFHMYEPFQFFANMVLPKWITK